MRNSGIVLAALSTLMVITGTNAVHAAPYAGAKKGKSIVKTLFACTDEDTASRALWNTPRNGRYLELTQAIASSARMQGCKPPPRKWEIESITASYRRVWKNDIVNSRLIQWYVAVGRTPDGQELAFIVRISGSVQTSEPQALPQKQ